MTQDINKCVAIIILNWNSYKYTYECLKSLESLSTKNFHVFLVDNDSTDGSFHKLGGDVAEKSFKLDITLIQTGSNLGFAGGNNVGIMDAYRQGYPFYWLLNNDTVIEPDALATLVRVMEDKSIGICGSKIYYHGTNLIWFAGGRVNKWLGETTHTGAAELDKGQYNASSEVDYITGCSLFFRRELIETVGLMNDDYFLYFEETEWNLRASNMNWKLVYVPESVVHHKVSVSSGGEKNLAPYVFYYNLRNAFMMIYRTQSFSKRGTAFIYMILKYLKFTLKIIIKNQDRKNERFWYLNQGVKSIFTKKMGKHPVFNPKL
jgi:GT2 family glycosyltransferase